MIDADTMHPQLAECLNRNDCFGVVSHMRPDGDAIGSTLALALALKSLGKRVYVWNADPVPARYAFLEGAELMQPLPESLPADMQVLVCLDCGAWKRLGESAEQLLTAAPFKVNIDHHATNERYGNINIIEPDTAATGFVLFRLFTRLGIAISPAMANALYVAISTDTGSFQYASTTAEVMRAVASLIECGVDVQEVNRRLYQEQSPTALRVQAEVLSNMQSLLGGRVVYYAMPLATKQAMRLGLEDTKDMVDIIRVMQGSLVALIFEEMEGGVVRVSLRSKHPRISVADIAQQFGGGGHTMAAGIRMRGAFAECCKKVLAAACRAVESA